MSRKQEQDLFVQANSDHPVDDRVSRRDILVASTVVAASLMLSPVALSQSGRSKFRRIPPQYIAALSDPQAHSGSNAQEWGLWRKDPGPRGVDLNDYDRLQANGGVAPGKGTRNNKDCGWE